MGRRLRWGIVILILVLMVGLGVLAGPNWIAVWNRDREFDEIAARVRRWGVHLHREVIVPRPLQPLRGTVNDRIVDLFGEHRGNQVGTWGTQATKSQLAEVLKGQPFTLVTLGGAVNLDDDWVAGIQATSSVAMLHLDGTSITDDCVGKLLEMNGLVELGLVDTAISDAAIDRLRKLPDLIALSVGGPNFRSVRLIEGQLVDQAGRPAIESGARLYHVQGRIKAEGFASELGNVRVMIRTPSTPPPWKIIPYGWNPSYGEVGMLDQQSPGTSTFRVPISGLPAAPLIIEIWVDVRSAGRPKPSISCLAGRFRAVLSPPAMPLNGPR